MTILFCLPHANVFFQLFFALQVLVGSSLLGIVIRHLNSGGGAYNISTNGSPPALAYYRWSDISNLVSEAIGKSTFLVFKAMEDTMATGTWQIPMTEPFSWLHRLQGKTQFVSNQRCLPPPPPKIGPLKVLIEKFPEKNTKICSKMGFEQGCGIGRFSTDSEFDSGVRRFRNRFRNRFRRFRGSVTIPPLPAIVCWLETIYLYFFYYYLKFNCPH